MQLEFHQLDRRWEHLRARHPARQRGLLSSLAESGQQTPIVVVAAEGQADRSVVIDGYKRIVALAQLGRDTVGMADERRNQASQGPVTRMSGLRGRRRWCGGSDCGAGRVVPAGLKSA